MLTCYYYKEGFISRSREEEWIRIGIDLGFWPSFSVPFFTDSGFYFMGKNRRLGGFRLEEGDQGGCLCGPLGVCRKTGTSFQVESLYNGLGESRESGKPYVVS